VGSVVSRVVLGHVSLSTWFSLPILVQPAASYSLIIPYQGCMVLILTASLNKKHKKYPLSSLFSGFPMEEKVGNEISLDSNSFM
jgi:hypothetical protein